jgi:hypothetical protein
LKPAHCSNTALQKATAWSPSFAIGQTMPSVTALRDSIVRCAFRLSFSASVGTIL